MRPETLFQTLSDPTRLRIIQLLEGEPSTAGNLARSTQAKAPALSQHLKALKQAGLVDSRKEGRTVVYRMAPAAKRILEEATRSLPGQRGRAPSRLSARNRLLGVITSIERDRVTSSVTLDVSGQKVQAVITTEALNELGLDVGDHAFAVVKATEVMLMR